MGAGGGASGSWLASSIAGGWPRQTGPRLAILSGGRRGSPAVRRGRLGCGYCQPLVQAVRGVPRSVSLRQLFEEFPLLRCLLCRAVRTWKAGHFSVALVSSSPGLVFGCWVLLVEYSVLDFSGDSVCSPLGSTVDTCSSGLWISAVRTDTCVNAVSKTTTNDGKHREGCVSLGVSFGAFGWRS